MAASAFFIHGYFQQAHAHISEAIITDEMLSQLISEEVETIH